MYIRGTTVMEAGRTQSRQCIKWLNPDPASKQRSSKQSAIGGVFHELRQCDKQDSEAFACVVRWTTSTT
jgi:hypothetical protein